MKLFNTIVIFDVYVIAEDSAEARATAVTWVKEGLTPSEVTALEARSEGNIRNSWRDQKPLVGASIPDKEFEKNIKGHSTIEMFQQIYQNR